MEEPGISHAIGDGGISVDLVSFLRTKDILFQITPRASFDSSD
jgi:hypothetical protein